MKTVGISCSGKSLILLIDGICYTSPCAWSDLDRLTAREVLSVDPAALTKQEVSDPLENPLARLGWFVLGAGVTFSSSHRERRLEAIRGGSLTDVIDDGGPTPYDVVYDPQNPPEVFFKALTAGHFAKPDELFIRSDGGNSVPEPERVLIINRLGEILAECVGSDTTARQLESMSPLYLPAAKTYAGCTTLSPIWTVREDRSQPVEIEMTILRNGQIVYQDRYLSTEMKRTPESLVAHAKTLLAPENSPFGLFTGTGIVPPLEFDLERGDQVTIRSEQVGTLSATVHIAIVGRS